MVHLCNCQIHCWCARPNVVVDPSLNKLQGFFFFFNLVQICSSKLVLSLVPNKIKVDKMEQIGPKWTK